MAVAGEKSVAVDSVATSVVDARSTAASTSNAETRPRVPEGSTSGRPWYGPP